MQPGASFVVGISDIVRVYRDADGSVAFKIGAFIQTFDHDTANVFDVALRDDRCLAAYSTEDGYTMLVEATRVRGPVHVTMLRDDVPTDSRRVAMTDTRWFVASESEVHALAHPRGAFTLIALDALDLAASPTELCIADPRGLTWFDADCRVSARRMLGSPTAIAYDRLARGWLVASDGDVLQLAHPDAEPIVLARGIGLATRIRRDARALYASTGDRLVEVLGIDQGPTTNEPTTIATYAPGFTQFDAAFELYVDEGSGPAPFYVHTECGCRTRSIEVLEHWGETRPDASADYFERRRCPKCRKTWIAGPLY